MCLINRSSFNPPSLLWKRTILCTLSKSKVKDILFYSYITYSYTWLTPWVLGIGMARPESWRTSVHNTSILDRSFSISFEFELLVCNSSVYWERKDVGLFMNAAVRSDMLACFNLGANLWNLARLQCQPLDPFPRLDLNSSTLSTCMRVWESLSKYWHWP